MKTFISFTLLLIVNQSFASDEKYIEAMQKNIAGVYQAQSIEELQKHVNALERIGGAEKSKWEPFYYAAFGYIMMSTRGEQPTKRDAWLDQATTALAKAGEISQDNAEIVALEGFILMMKVAVDPGTRGPQLSGLAMQTFGKALAIDPNNPRALSLLSQMQLGTARFFNSPIDEACKSAKAALEKFESFKSDNPLTPTWGKEMTKELVSQCN